MVVNHSSNGPGTRKPSLVIQPLNEVIPEREKAIESLANEIHQAVADGDEELLAILRETAGRELEIFRAEESHRDPARSEWIWRVMMSTVCDALGDYELGLKYDLESLQFARNAVEEAKSLINACVGYRRVGQYEQAVAYGLKASELLPHADWVWVYLALAMYKAGHKQAAGKIVSTLANQTNIHDPSNVLLVHLRYEQEFREMSDLPEVQKMVVELTPR